MRISHAVRRSAVALVTALTVATSLSTIPAHAAGSDAGLYGAADPTYDGVYRQSLAILGLAGNGVTPPASAISWLLGQQCADGSFMPYRADTTIPCPKADPDAYTGPDTNQTALALSALMVLDDSELRLPTKTVTAIVRAADKAGVWLASAQNADGGWPYYAGGASDANSTGLALAGLLTQAPNRDITAYRKASRFLGRLSAPCPSGGGLSYQAGSKPDALATSQGLIGLVGPVPIRGPRRLAVAAPCSNTSQAKAVSFLARALAPTGVLTSAFGTDPDYSTTATAVLGLVGAGQGRASVAKATAALKANAASYVGAGATANPGAAGVLMLVAEATGARPTSFGDVNLVTTLASTLRR